jgi:DNA-binding protein HU-beta
MASSAPKKTVAKKTAAKKAAPKKKTAAKKAPAKKAPAKKKPAPKNAVEEIVSTLGLEEVAAEKLEEVSEIAEQIIWEQVDKIQEEIAAKKKTLFAKIFKFLKK